MAKKKSRKAATKSSKRIKQRSQPKQKASKKPKGNAGKIINPISDANQSAARRLTRKPAKSDKDGATGGTYVVGKGRPPNHTKFRKNTSGNPAGRPKGSKNLATILRQAADTPLIATVDGKPKKITTLMANVFQLATKGAQGDHRSQVKFIEAIAKLEQQTETNRPAEFPFEPSDLEVLKAAHLRLSQSTPTASS